MNKRTKKIITILAILLLTSSVVYGDLNEKIGTHWSKSTIERGFVDSYFPYLAENNYSRFNPNGRITAAEFSRSINLLFNQYNFNTETLRGEGNLSREEMVNILGGKLKALGILTDGSVNLPFNDISSMSKENIDMLKILYKAGIIQGDTNTQFSPNRDLSQAEAVITLQRARGPLGNAKASIPFKILGTMQSFKGNEEITVIPQDEKVLVTITKEFPTPGYSMEIEDIVKTGNGYKINFNIEGPPKDSIQLQVITYKTITLEIGKEVLGDGPYNFILDGYNTN